MVTICFVVGGDWLKVLASGLMRRADKVATLMECSDGRHLVLIEPLHDGKSCSEWLCGDDYRVWLLCLAKVADV